jgi:hypothetical protein
MIKIKVKRIINYSSHLLTKETGADDTCEFLKRMCPANNIFQSLRIRFVYSVWFL